MKICYDQGYNDIGVVIATKGRHYLFTCSSISRHWELFFPNRLLELLPTIAASMFVKFKRNLYKSVIEIFWDEVFMVRNTVKN